MIQPQISTISLETKKGEFEMSRPWLLLANFVVVAFSATPACAQMYRCYNTGATYLSDKPCAPTAPKVDKLVSVGPLRTEPARTYSSSSYYRGSNQLEKAPAHQKYLSGTCSSMADAIRTAPTRGVNYQVINDLRAEYENKCREEDRLARTQAYEEERQASREKMKSLNAVNEAKDASARTEAQCNAMRDVLANKRQKMDGMTPGEKTNFQTLQTSFNDRCVRPH